MQVGSEITSCDVGQLDLYYRKGAKDTEVCSMLSTEGRDLLDLGRSTMSFLPLFLQASSRRLKCILPRRQHNDFFASFASLRLIQIFREKIRGLALNTQKRIVIGDQALREDDRVFAPIVIRVITRSGTELMEIGREVQLDRDNIGLPDFEQNRVCTRLPRGLGQVIEHATADPATLIIRVDTEIQHVRFSAVQHNDTVCDDGFLVLIDPATVANPETIPKNSHGPGMLVGGDFDINDSPQIVNRHLADFVTSPHFLPSARTTMGIQHRFYEFQILPGFAFFYRLTQQVGGMITHDQWNAGILMRPSPQ